MHKHKICAAAQLLEPAKTGTPTRCKYCGCINPRWSQLTCPGSALVVPGLGECLARNASISLHTAAGWSHCTQWLQFCSTCSSLASATCTAHQHIAPTGVTTATGKF